MKRLTLVTLLGIGAFLLGRYWQDLSVHAAREPGAGGAVAGNGDVNGSGVIDLSDPVYLLNFLFLGGPRPLPCAGGGAGSGLPDTGQTQCYDCSGKPTQCVDCSGRPRPCGGFTASFLTLQDSFQRRGCPNDANRFTVDANANSEDTVTDNCTGLVWQRFTADLDGDRIADRLTWCDALKYCFDSTYAGHNDWRLPSVRELESIVDYGRFGPAIAPSFLFGGGAGGANGAGATVDPNAFWSSTSAAADDPGVSAWSVDFYAGATRGSQSKTLGLLVRAVRGG